MQDFIDGLGPAQIVGRQVLGIYILDSLKYILKCKRMMLFIVLL